MDSDDPEDRIAELKRQLAEHEAHRRAGTSTGRGQGGSPGSSRLAGAPLPRRTSGGWAGRRGSRPRVRGRPVGKICGPVDPRAAGGLPNPRWRSIGRQSSAQRHRRVCRRNDRQHLQARQGDHQRLGHSVVYSGQGAAPDYGAPAGFGSGIRPAPGFTYQDGSKRQATRSRRRPRGTRGWGDRIGVIVGALGLCIGAAAALTATMPASALWIEPLCGDSGYQLASNGCSFECVGAQAHTTPTRWRSLLSRPWGAPLVLGVAVAIGFMVWRSFRRPGSDPSSARAASLRHQLTGSSFIP